MLKKKDILNSASPNILFIVVIYRRQTGSIWRFNSLHAVTRSRRHIFLPDLLLVIERCLRHHSTSTRQKASLANISPTPMRPHDIPLSGVRKSCRRWFLRVFSLSRSIGTPEPVSKGLSGGWYEMGRREDRRGANGLRSGGRHFVLHRHEFVSLRSCRPPFSLLFLSLLCSHRRNPISFSRFPARSPRRPASTRAEKLRQSAEPSHQVKIHHVRLIPRASRHPEYQERSFQINVPSV